MKKIELQQDNINNLLKLIQENPDLEIIPMVDSEIVVNDDYCYWSGSWGNARVDEYWADDERIYFRSEDEEDLIESQLDDIFGTYDDFKTNEELEEIAKENISNYNWKKVIVVKINCL